MSLGNNLFRIRQDKGLTQDEVGSRAGLETSFLSRVEENQVEPTMETLAKLASALDVPITSLFHERSQARADDMTYGKEQLQLMRMTEFIAVHGSKKVRKSLAVVLESLMNHSTRGEDH